MNSSRTTRRPARLRFEPLEDRAVPAVITVDDSGGAMFTTITAANNGDVIQVADGTDHESNIQVNKDVTIVGQSRAGVIVTPDVPDVNDDSSFGLAFRHAFIIESDGVTIQTLTIDGNLLNVPGVYGYRDGIITDFNFTPGPYNALTVQDVSINDVYRRGIQISDVSTGHVITGNSIDNVGLNNLEGIGIVTLGGSGTFTTTRSPARRPVSRPTSPTPAPGPGRSRRRSRGTPSRSGTCPPPGPAVGSGCGCTGWSTGVRCPGTRSP